MTTSNTIYIIGAGAVGKALAVFLNLQQQKVIMLRGHVDNIPEKDEIITVELNDGTSLNAAIKISSFSNYQTLDGIIVLTNKSYGNRQLAEKLSNKTGNSPLVILQNGLNIEQPFLEAGFKHLYRCVLFTSCQQAAANTVQFKPVNVSRLGIVSGNETVLTAITVQLNNPYLQFSAVDDIQPVIWTKAIVNSVFNSVCPLLETDNGIFTRNVTALNMAQRVITECVSIATAKGIFLQISNIMDTLLMISRSSSGQLISTYQDILNKRETEIETLNFAFVHIAEQLKLPAAVAETRLLGELVQLKSAISRAL